MKKLLISLNRLSWSLLLGGALILGTSACSTGTSEGEVNVEESDFKDKSPTEHNPQGLSDETQDNGGPAAPGAMTSDSAYDEVYERQQQKSRQQTGGSSNQGYGGAAERNKNDKENQ
ncbi:hypothetical protein [Rufibacter psychrotolerans]|uniref:hypothetical protein n=1 Tax=Rufibacter psychrotolerans TaxID=2812556 RepID=UPI001968305E|nr:hypothetical protein [Rufibacter sp. SYSU D00308]